MAAALHSRVAAFGLLAVMLVSCGQKPGVHAPDAGLPMAATTTPAAPAAPAPEPGQQAPSNADAPVGDSATAPSTDAVAQPVGPAPAAGPQAGATAAPAPVPTEPATAGPRPAQPRGTDRTGVTDTTITLAAHAPVTGAAPLPTLVFEESSDLYWRWLKDVHGQDVLGREIELVFQDDRYTPSTARQVCRQLMEVGFILSGVGADGIAACAPLAAQQGVPYVAAGADEGDLTGNRWYFATGATYPQQSEFFTQYIAANHPGQKAAAVAIDTSSWNAAVDAWEAGLASRNIDSAEALRHPRDGTDWYAPFVRSLMDDGVEIVYMLTSPLHIIRFAQVADDFGADFHFLVIAPGGLLALLENGCPQLSNTTSFSFWPSLDVIDQFDPEFRQAIERYDVSQENLDLSLALWGASKFAHEMFLEYERRFGRDLTREDFRDVVETMTVSTGIFPDQTFTPDNHFGTRPGIHVLLADCDREGWADGGTFRTSF